MGEISGVETSTNKPIVGPPYDQYHEHTLMHECEQLDIKINSQADGVLN